MARTMSCGDQYGWIQEKQESKIDELKDEMDCLKIEINLLRESMKARNSFLDFKKFKFIEEEEKLSNQLEAIYNVDNLMPF